ncbi:MAG: hypothetical protein WCL06_00070 [Bacteroidota bacterium]
MKKWTLQDVEKAQGLPVTKKGMKHDNPEERLCIEVSDWINLQYPNLIYHFDFGSGLRMTKKQAGKQKRLNKVRGYPDLQINFPTRHYCGLFIEIKVNRVWKKDGTLIKDDHVAEQERLLVRLEKLGYCAMFGCGFEEIKDIVHKYMLGREF